MTDYEKTEVEYKDSPYDVCGNVSLSDENDGETVGRADFQGKATFKDITIDELLEIYENGKEAE